MKGGSRSKKSKSEFIASIPRALYVVVHTEMLDPCTLSCPLLNIYFRAKERSNFTRPPNCILHANTEKKENYTEKKGKLG